MSNMSYCRFRNTLEDLQDCVESMDDLDINDDDEKKARDRMLMLIGDASLDYEDEINELRAAKFARLKAKAAK